MSKVVIKSRDVHIEARRLESCAKKSVELLQQDGVVHAIQIQCSCGEPTVIELEYPRDQQECAGSKA
jgi:hypothetical protein